MPESAYRDRIFPPDEVRRILRRAAELEDATRPPRGAGRGHTLEEIERIAGDAGISQDALNRALAGEDVARRSAARAWSFAGAPARVSVERSVVGHVSAASHGKLAKIMRKTVGELGNAQVLGDSLSWSHSMQGGRSVYAIVEPDSDGTVTVRIDENLRGLQGGLYGGIMGGGGGGGFSLVAALMAQIAPNLIPIAFAAWMVAMYLLARTIYVRRFRAREQELGQIADEIAASIAAGDVRVGVEGPRSRIADGKQETQDADSDTEEPPRRAGA